MNTCPKCEGNGVCSSLSAIGWTDGSNSNEPRLIYCINSNVLLVSRIYKCPCEHRVLAHHPDILSRFKVQNLGCVVPFHLWHISGFTKSLMEYIDNLSHQGITMQQIEVLLAQNRAQLFYSLREQFVKISLARSGPDNDFPEFTSPLVSNWRQSPSRHAVQACFLHNFWLRESTYNYLMSQTTLSVGSAWASLDHTFRCVSNIGTVRSADNRWVKQYSGLLCVLNGDGEVLSWKLTKSLSFASMEDVLCTLKERFRRQGKNLEEFFIDNCCTFRSKLRSVFGDNLRVYLDIFHAVQRVSAKIPKKHPYRQECMRDLRLVFRDPTDQGPVRTKVTPPPLILEQQLLHFQQKWKDVSYNDKCILPPIAIKEIQCLLVHVRKGCISGILPGRGTNRNERLHKDINTHMRNSRYGVELAYALLTESFFSHNEILRAKRENRPVLPIIAYACNAQASIEKFGLLSSTVPPPTSPLFQLQKVKMADLTHNEVQEALQSMDITLPLLEALQHDDIDMTEEDVFMILTQAISAYYVSISIKPLTTTADFVASNAFFLSSLCITQGLTSIANKKIDNEQLEPLLESWKLTRVPSVGNGDCLFRSLAYCLIYRMQQGDVAIKQQLVRIGVPEEHLNNLEYIQRLLRKRMVEEWQENTEYYQGYISDDLSILSQQFLQDGHFTGDAGDLMVLTLANVLCIPITLFTSIETCLSSVYIMPTSQSAISTEPLLLAFTQDGPGHYDAVIHDVSSSETKATKDAVKCNCGRKPNFEGKVCLSKRCKCYRLQKKCNHACRCKSCSNEFGSRPLVSAKRKRKSYEEQDRQPLKGRLTEEFMCFKLEVVNKGKVTLLENLILKGIVIYLILHGLQITPQVVKKIYDIMHFLCMKSEYVEFPIFERTERFVKTFLLKILRILEMFNYHIL